jgi:hypothetical protein
MRYGLIRISADLPAAAIQRQLIEMTGCDVMLEERSSTSQGRNVLIQLLHGLRDGDEVVVHGLQAFDANLGQIVRLLHRFHEAGVTLRLVGGEQVESFKPQGPVPRVLALLADHEARHRAPPPTRRRQRPTGAPLTLHQLRFARDMRRRGHSMREIGLVFQLSPDEITALIGRRGEAEGPSDAEADGPRDAAIR